MLALLTGVAANIQRATTNTDSRHCIPLNNFTVCYGNTDSSMYIENYHLTELNSVYFIENKERFQNEYSKSPDLTAYFVYDRSFNYSKLINFFNFMLKNNCDTFYLRNDSIFLFPGKATPEIENASLYTLNSKSEIPNI